MPRYVNLTSHPVTVAGVRLPRCPVADRPGLLLCYDGGGEPNADGEREFVVRHQTDGLPGPEPGVVLLCEEHVAAQAAREGREDVGMPLSLYFGPETLGIGFFSPNTDTWICSDAAAWDADALDGARTEGFGDAR